jgi:hypothetical protein
MWLAIAACSGIAYTKVGPQHRRLSAITRPTLRFTPKHTLLFDDGTLFAPQGGEPICDYLTSSKRRHTQVKRLHLHLQSCQDSAAQFEEYFEALLLANSAQVPFTMTCSGALQDSLMSRLVVDHDHIGHVPMDTTGRSWTPEDLCRNESSSLYLVKDTIRLTLQEVVPKTAVDDMVIQFDPSVPVSTYTELIAEARFEGGSIETIAIVGTGPHLLVQHLERSFPDIVIQTIDEEEDLLHLYSRLMFAKVAGVCSTPSLCSYAMLSGVGGFLNQEGSSEWLLSATKAESSKVDVFKAASVRVS